MPWPQISFQLSRILLKAQRGALTNTSNRHDDLSSTLGQTAGYFVTAVSRHKWMIHSVPLRHPLPKPSWRWLLASVSEIIQWARNWGRVKSKARAWHLLKCHTVYFICMREASGPERLQSCRQQHSPYSVSVMGGEYESLGRQQVGWPIVCKSHHLLQGLWTNASDYD